MSGLVFRTRKDLESARAAGTVDYMNYLSLSELFDKQEKATRPATTGAGGRIPGANTSLPAGSAGTAIQALSKMIAEGKCDALDIATKIKAGTSPEFLAAHNGMDMGEAVLAAMEAEHVVHKPGPKIETREQAVAVIKEFEANKNDLGDQVAAAMLRQQFGIYEVLQ